MLLDFLIDAIHLKIQFFIHIRNTRRFPKGKCASRRRTATNEVDVLARAAYNPHVSVKSIAGDGGVSLLQLIWYWNLIPKKTFKFHESTTWIAIKFVDFIYRWRFYATLFTNSKYSSPYSVVWWEWFLKLWNSLPS